jgi:hypothetical protein
VNPLTFLVRLPLLPVRSFVRLAILITEEVERERADPATIRRELERVERARASGEISDEQATELQQVVFTEFARARHGPATAPAVRAD